MPGKFPRVMDGGPDLPLFFELGNFDPPYEGLHILTCHQMGQSEVW